MAETAPPLILHVIHHLMIGGMENGLVNLINHMPAGEYRHAVVCIEDYSDFRRRITRPDVEVLALHRSRIGVWRLRRELYRLCRRLRPQIVHSRNLSGLDALPPARLARVAHCIHSEHGWDVDNLDGKRWKPAALRRLHAPLIQRYITVSKHLQQFLVERVGVNPARISQVYNGVDTERFHPAELGSGDRRERLPAGFAADDALLIGTVGRAQPVKDQATLLRAFARLLGDRPALRGRLRLMLIGGGPLLDELRRLTFDLRIAEQCWLPGPQNDIPALLRALDVFVLPSLNEGISNTVLEAMASGLPVVATAVGGNPELVEDGVCGRLFTPGDDTALTRLLAGYVLRDGDLLRQVHGRAARRRAEQQFSLATMVARYRAAYDQLCRSDRRRL